jgi:hypothetical protein
MPKAIITGHTRGIGLIFSNHLISKGWEVIGFNTSTGLDDVVETAQGCDLFINNAYANGRQIEFLNKLHLCVGKMIVCGSVAAFYKDPQLPEYSDHKNELAVEVTKLQNKGIKILMLHLSSAGYNNSDALIKIIDLWLEYPHITAVSFDTTGEPN